MLLGREGGFRGLETLLNVHDDHTGVLVIFH